MAKTRTQKETDVAKLHDSFTKAQLSVLTDYRGLDVPSIQALRAQLREQDSSYVVAKNTLVKLAIKNSPAAEIDPSLLQGPMAVAFGSDAATTAKTLVEFAKRNEALDIIGAVDADGRFMDSAQVSALAKLPSREQLLGQLVGTIAAPISGLARVLQANLTGVLYALNAIKESKGV